MDEVKFILVFMNDIQDLQNADVLSAWDNRIVVRRRYANASDRLVSIGSDSNGRLIEMVASQIPNGT